MESIEVVLKLVGLIIANKRLSYACQVHRYVCSHLYSMHATGKLELPTSIVITVQVSRTVLAIWKELKIDSLHLRQSVDRNVCGASLYRLQLYMNFN